MASKISCHGPVGSTLVIVIDTTIKIYITHFKYSGISGKTQIMFALLVTTGYLNLFTNFISLYNSSMKVMIIGSAYAALYLMFHGTYIWQQRLVLPSQP